MTQSKYNAREIAALFGRGENIMQWIRAKEGQALNSPSAILYSYDAQAGTYLAGLQNPDVVGLKAKFGSRLGGLLDELAPTSLLDAGTGEATSLVPTLAAMRRVPKVFGFDISLSRVLVAKQHLAENGYGAASLFVGTLDRIPFADSSIDVVITVHAIEPNRAGVTNIVSELLRVTRRHLVMIEPSYELGDAATRANIDRHQYVVGLPDKLRELGHTPRIFEPWGIDQNPSNQAALLVVDKSPSGTPGTDGFVSTVSRLPLVRRQDCWFCPGDGHAFPIIQGIPCLTIDHAILASKLADFEDSPPWAGT
jgi:SAM-dependent methyltransferase